MTTDQVKGKAEKRAFQWLYNELSDNYLSLDESDEDVVIDVAPDFSRDIQGLIDEFGHVKCMKYFVSIGWMKVEDDDIPDN